jgi:hypothetical protein
VTAHIDHLVIAAATLPDGVAWCEHTLGMSPAPGGEHALFGTHNRLLKLDRADGQPAYLEIIAINPAATPSRPSPLRRWFDLDDAALQTRLTEHGPQLVHWVVRVDAIDDATARLQPLDIDPGPVLQASRATSQGELRWHITVRDDGRRLFDGALPTLIQWNGTHPAHSLPDSGLSLAAFEVSHPRTQALQGALKAIGLDHVPVADEPPTLLAQLHTPRGPLTLAAPL